MGVADIDRADLCALQSLDWSCVLLPVSPPLLAEAEQSDMIWLVLGCSWLRADLCVLLSVPPCLKQNNLKRDTADFFCVCCCHQAKLSFSCCHWTYIWIAVIVLILYVVCVFFSSPWYCWHSWPSVQCQVTYFPCLKQTSHWHQDGWSLCTTGLSVSVPVIILRWICVVDRTLKSKN